MLPERVDMRFIRHVADPAGLASRLGHLAEDHHGLVICHPKPGSRTLDWLASDVLSALGKQRDVTGAPKNERERWRLAGVWLAAERTAELVVLEATAVPAAMWLHLIEQCVDVGCSLSLVVSGNAPSRRHKDVLSRFSFDKEDFDDAWARWTQEHRAPGDDEPAPEVPTSDSKRRCGSVAPLEDAFPRVPRADFTVFRARCRSVLSATDFAAVDEVFMTTLARAHAFMQSGQPSPDGAAAWLHRLLTQTESLDEAVTQLRAAQAAFFRAGHLLQLDTWRFIAHAEDGALTVMTPDVADRLRWYQHPRYGAAGVLALVTGLTPGGLIDLNIHDVATDGSNVDVANGPCNVPGYAQALVRAQLLDRAYNGACPDDPLFASAGRNGATERLTARRIQRTFRVLGEETGVRLASHWTRQSARPDERWMRKLGLTLQELGR